MACQMCSLCFCSSFNAASGDLEQGFQVSCSGGLLEFAAELETDITNVGGDVHVEVSDSVNTFIGDVTGECGTHVLNSIAGNVILQPPSTTTRLSGFH